MAGRVYIRSYDDVCQVPAHKQNNDLNDDGDNNEHECLAWSDVYLERDDRRAYTECTVGGCVFYYLIGRDGKSRLCLSILILCKAEIG